MESREIEMALLAAILKDPDAIAIVAGKVSKADFSSEVVGRSIEHIVELKESGLPVADKRFMLRALNELGVIGDDGPGKISRDELLSALDDAIPSSVAEYCELIVRRAVLSGLRRALLESSSEIDAPGVNPFEIARKVQSRTEEIARRETLRIRSIAEYSMEYVEQLRKSMSQSSAPSLPTGIPSLDMYIGGLKPGEVTLIAARPNQGKTALGWQMLEYNALRERNCLFVSLEMHGSELSERMISSATNIETSRIRKLDITEDELGIIEQEASSHAGLPLYIYDGRGATVRKIRTIVQLMRSKMPVHLIAIDYVQIIKASRPMMQTNDQLKDVAESLRDLARELEVPVVVLAQLNRNADKEKPAMSHIKGGAGPEEAADVVVLIHNPKPETKAHDERRQAQLIVAKGRNVSTGEISVYWNPTSTSFTDFE